MGIELIHGFLSEQQKVSPQWGYIDVTETVLVEMSSPTENAIDVVNALPSGVGTVTGTNPKGIAFTIDVSTHPDASALVFRRAGDVVRVQDGGCFWHIPMTYSTQSFYQLMGGTSTGGGGGGANPNPKHRKDQREVLNPIDKPVVWNRSSSIVQKETYKHGTSGDPIVHTNFLPITEPYKYEEVHSSHTFSYNVAFNDFDDLDYSLYLGKVDNAGVFGSVPYFWKLTGYTAAEEYESIGNVGAKTDYHYVRVSLTFESNPSLWTEDAKLVSMSTLQLKLQPAVGLVPAYFYYAQILVSRTEYAKQPWPLLSTGAAVSYDSNDPTTYGYVDHGYPRLANLKTVAAIRSLSIP